jgi:hypothetical protein
MKRKTLTIRLLILLVIVLILIQFIQIDRSPPPADPQQTIQAQLDIPATVHQSLQQACYDCHSYATEYPWYSYVAPLSWWIGDHVEHGRSHLNFSVWGTYDAEKRAKAIEEILEEVEADAMPLRSYRRLHAAANWSDAQKAEVLAWFRGLE